MHVRDVVNLGDTFNACAIDTVTKTTKRWTHNACVPRHGPSLRVEPGSESGVRSRAIEVLLRVVFACPRQLYGNADRLGNLDRFADEIHASAPSETATEECCVNLNLVGG